MWNDLYWKWWYHSNQIEPSSFSSAILICTESLMPSLMRLLKLETYYSMSRNLIDVKRWVVLQLLRMLLGKYWQTACVWQFMKWSNMTWQKPTETGSSWFPIIVFTHANRFTRYANQTQWRSADDLYPFHDYSGKFLPLILRRENN